MAIYAVEYLYAPDQAAGRDEHRPVHRGWLAELVEQGIVLSSGPYPDGSGALIIFSAEDTAAMDTLLAQDPFARQDLIASKRVVQWQPVMGALS